MDWPLRTEKASATVPAPVNPPVRETLERVSPAVAALFEPVHADGSHAVLDLGPASPSSFNVYGRFARWIRFAEALSLPLPIYDSADPFRVVPENPQQPYDLVLAWNVFDVVPPEARRLLVERLIEITSDDARLLVIAGIGGVRSAPQNFSLLSEDRMRYEIAPGGAFYPPILPAEMAQLLEPFRIERAFSSSAGFREYLALRPVGRPLE
jgi:hypothetical protein